MTLVIRDPSKRPSALGVGQEETVPSSGLRLAQSYPPPAMLSIHHLQHKGSQHSYCLKKQPSDSNCKLPGAWHAFLKLFPKPRARSHATHFSNKTMSGSHRDSEGTRMAVIPPYSSGFQESLWSIHSCKKPAESSAHSYTTASFLLPPPASEGLHCTAQWAELGVSLLSCREDARQA